MSDRTESLHPDLDPAELERVERQLRQSLAQEARRVRPGDRLDAILHGAHEAGPATVTGGTGPRRWLAPVAAAALVAAIAGGAWWATQDPGTTPTPAGSPSASAPSPSTSVSPTSAPATTQPTGSSTTASGATVQVALPAYFVGPVGDAVPTYKLFREFVRAPLPQQATDVDRVLASLSLAMNAQPYSNTDGYLQPWSGTRATGATVTRDRIDVELSGPGAEGFTPEVQRLAVQELVWTAQAALGRGAIPVHFEVAGGGQLFGSISADQLFTRPSADESWRDLAPIWVTAPTRDQVVAARTPVTLEGEATVFEATVQWELDRGGAKVGGGTAMATVGAPSRGTYSVALGRLTAGTYTVRVWAASPKDGSVAAEDSVTFTVR